MAVIPPSSTHACMDDTAGGNSWDGTEALALAGHPTREAIALHKALWQEKGGKGLHRRLI